VLPFPNIEPLIVSGQNGTSAVIVDNARHYNPVAIDSTGKNVTYLPINGKFSMTGAEKFVNSGWMWPTGLVPPGAAPINSFTVYISLYMHCTSMDEWRCYGQIRKIFKL
jgi:hypothetical protein